MLFNSRSHLLVLVLVLLTGLSGCSQFTGESSTSTPIEYHDDAGAYLLTADEIDGDWSLNQTRDGDLDPIGLESGRAIELEDGENQLTVAVAVFESPSDASSFLGDRQNTYESNGLSVNNESLGEEGISVTNGQTTFVDVRETNVAVEVYGDVAISTAKQIANSQLEKITG